MYIPNTGIKVTAKAIIKAMRTKYGLHYRRIKRVAYIGNSERNKVLRSLYAQKMLLIYN